MSLLSWILSVGLLAALLSSVPLTEIWIALQEVAPGLVFLAMAVAGAGLWLRGVRWAIFYSPEHRVTSGVAAKLAVFGLALNAVLPGKLGEVARVGLAAQRFHAEVRFIVATVMAERLLDGLTLLALLGVALGTLPALEVLGSVEILSIQVEGGTLYRVIRVLAATCLVLAAAIISLSLRPVQRLFERFLLRAGPESVGGVVRWLMVTWQGLSAGFAKLQQPKSAAGLVACSILIWGSLAACNWIASFAIQGISISLAQALVVTALGIAMASIPSAPGAWGFYEAGVVLALLGTGVDFEPAVGITYAFVSHLCQFLPTVVVGLFLAVGERRSLSSLRRITQAASESQEYEMGRHTPGTESDGS